VDHVTLAHINVFSATSGATRTIQPASKARTLSIPSDLHMLHAKKPEAMVAGICTNFNTTLGETIGLRNENKLSKYKYGGL
jgi:hypothetical protein